MAIVPSRIVLSVAAFGVAAAAAIAQSAPPPVEPELRARLGFLGPVRHEVGDGIDLLQVGDVDGDGRDEVVVEHPGRGRIEILDLVGDALESMRVEVRSLDSGGILSGLRIADVDGDGRLDLLTLDRRGRLEVRPVDGAAAGIGVDVGSPAGNGALRAGDLDGDGNAEAIAWTEDGLVVVAGLAAVPRLARPIALPAEQPRALLLRDLDADGVLDLAIVTNDGETPLRVARGQGDGSFGPWLAFPLPRVRQAFAGSGVDGAALALIRDVRGRVVEHRIERRDDAGDDRAIEIHGIAPAKRGEFPFAVADLDGDGSRDLVLAHPQRAELVRLFDRGDAFEVRTVPGLAGVTSVAAGDLDGDGRTDLLLASPEEKTVAWISGAKPIDAFPERVITGTEAVSVGVAPDGSVLAVVRDGRRQAELVRVRRSGDGFGAPESLASLGRMSGEPLRLLVGEHDGVAGPDVALVVPSEGLRILRNTPDGGFAVPADGSPAAELAPKVADGAIGALPGGGMWIARGAFARRVALDAEGAPTVLRQVNAPPGCQEIALVAGTADDALWIVDRKAARLFRVGPGDVAATSTPLPGVGVTHVVPWSDGALLIGREGVARIRGGGGWVATELRSHEPPTDDTLYYGGAAADLDGDGVRELAVLDADVHGFQVLVAGGDRLRRGLVAPVFEPAEESGRLFEPRAIVAGDCDGDGREDLVLIAFDRVLIYLQER